MQALKGLLLACATLALAGCSSALSGLQPDQELYKFNAKLPDVDFGMNKTRVQYFMGVPKERLYQGNQEAWLWCQTSQRPDLADSYMVVYFYAARVAGIHTYGNRAEGNCETFFKPVQWLADPEKAMVEKVRRRD